VRVLGHGIGVGRGRDRCDSARARRHGSPRPLPGDVRMKLSKTLPAGPSRQEGSSGCSIQTAPPCAAAKQGPGGGAPRPTPGGSRAEHVQRAKPWRRHWGQGASRAGSQAGERSVGPFRVGLREREQAIAHSGTGALERAAECPPRFLNSAASRKVQAYPSVNRENRWVRSRDRSVFESTPGRPCRWPRQIKPS